MECWVGNAELGNINCTDYFPPSHRGVGVGPYGPEAAFQLPTYWNLILPYTLPVRYEIVASQNDVTIWKYYLKKNQKN